jgi:hypothetical protein
VLKEVIHPESPETRQRFENRIQKDIVDEMTAHGLDCRDLAHSLMFGEFTDLTALYGIFLRNRDTEKMKNLMAVMLQYASSVRGSGNLPHPRLSLGAWPISRWTCTKRRQHDGEGRVLWP